MKQTSVDFLIEKSNALNKKVFEGSIGRIEHAFALAKIEEQARQMHREEIEKSYMSGTAQFDNAAPIVYPLSSTEYYNQTYGEK